MRRIIKGPSCLKQSVSRLVNRIVTKEAWLSKKLLLRLIGVACLICFCLPLAGCWDRREIQDRGFVLAVGIDVADEGEKPGEGPEVARTETFVQPYGEKKYRVSLQVLKLVPSGGGGGAPSSGDNRTYVVSNTGHSMFEMIRDMLGQVSKSLWFEHLQVIILSEAVVKEEQIDHILDFFLRGAELRWRIKLYLTPGEARKLLEYQPPTGEPGGVFLANVIRNHVKSMHLGGMVADLGFVSQALSNKWDFVIPRVELADNVLKVGGSAVFKKNRFVGYFDEYATKGGKLISATGLSGTFTINCPDCPPDQGVLVFEMYRHETTLLPHVEGDNIYFTLDIRMWGNLAEVQCRSKAGHDTTNPEYIRKLEVLFAEEMKKEALYRFEEQKRLGVSVGFGKKLQGYYPKVWAKVKDNWDEVFQNIPLIVSANVTIRDIGDRK